MFHGVQSPCHEPVRHSRSPAVAQSRSMHPISAPRRRWSVSFSATVCWRPIQRMSATGKNPPPNASASSVIAAVGARE